MIFWNGMMVANSLMVPFFDLFCHVPMLLLHTCRQVIS
jgi:hypothetical protein